jgi:hypothetical protein
MLVVEELRPLNKEWDSFFISANIHRDSEGDIPLSAKESVLHSSKERKEDVIGKKRERNRRLIIQLANILEEKKVKSD